jgi:hypothetical protein
VTTIQVHWLPAPGHNAADAASMIREAVLLAPRESADHQSVGQHSPHQRPAQGDSRAVSISSCQIFRAKIYVSAPWLQWFDVSGSHKAKVCVGVSLCGFSVFGAVSLFDPAQQKNPIVSNDARLV